ncbi:MAG: NAD(P)/FAD-dependent oxidoreductase [Candidatus Marinimicrobia bacterium]|nr:NAD(P)/FAD-dependent oxidoreductase [Candidatus Neomarinimicrobiota bacterium]
MNRDIFEYDMAARAAEKGAKIKMKANVRELILKDDGTPAGVRVMVAGEMQDHYAKVIIAADGVESRIARQAGVNTALKPEDIEPCVQITASNIHLPETALYLYVGYCYAPGGYAWVFPKANHCANIGLGINGKYSESSRPAAYYMENFMQRFSRCLHTALYNRRRSVSTNLRPLTKNNLLIAGDAGRMVNPLNGGGITHAIYSGIQAGKMAADTCERPGKMAAYFLFTRRTFSGSSERTTSTSTGSKMWSISLRIKIITVSVRKSLRSISKSAVF